MSIQLAVTPKEYSAIKHNLAKALSDNFDINNQSNGKIEYMAAVTLGYTNHQSLKAAMTKALCQHQEDIVDKVRDELVAQCSYKGEDIKLLRKFSIDHVFADFYRIDTCFIIELVDGYAMKFGEYNDENYNNAISEICSLISERIQKLFTKK